ncbi:type II toxin-antitoxin system HicA family toxin [Treponema sp. OMZ 792]|uniref:type II toxin-antitoxin system HicA family toxin n=1 Tax=unclassified Treponema TaxID=2638727 RepID=UPI0020A4FF92|nr:MULTISPECIES: type II toxin-antitoxin system HicA family toxin [unclassified Treponema]UTC75204.1 type II toxin-antitoxin system HicA family toxin [Treponema sp. OMZ 792]UTC79211.1 type II toxin-antitoxin system HicA family toxin [Treponema sp. OMZ 798]
MSRDEKLIKRLLSKPRDFTYNELKRLLKALGYVETQSGKTSGSRVAFINLSDGHIIRLHKPHPNNELKQYQIEQIIYELQLKGVL